ncbi:hypothetical protein RvY_07315 [Ramazzottius varieornatus]|uniref:Tc1-like transposase DDE domain-containing protein n=1 Tax=Ramazzottius varieornatus TaxID=947166 RepID=A0A1D1V1P7_RAMVA|nr:hypothetical protein RvY_07315 [Ramazzottius varieornatus]
MVRGIPVDPTLVSVVFKLFSEKNKNLSAVGRVMGKDHKWVKNVIENYDPETKKRKVCWYLKEENRHDKDLQVAVATRIKGGITLWGAITACGPVALIRVDGRMDSGAYEDVLFERRLPYLEKHARDLVFQQDKCPVHTSRRMGVDMAV